MDMALDVKKLATAEFGSITAAQGIKVRDGQFAEADAMQSEIDNVYKKNLDEANQAYEAAASRRNGLRSLLTQMTEAEDAAEKNLSDAQAEATRLQTAIQQAIPDGQVSLVSGSHDIDRIHFAKRNIQR